MTYPNSRVIDYVYGSGLDTTISRLTSLASSSTTLESLSYLGLGTVVKRAHPEPGVDLTYIKQSGESSGDAGDQYTGLDRFGRVVDQRWIKTSDGSHTDRFKYGYDRDSNRLYRENVVNAAFSELYHADGASAGYDNLGQLVEFQRGTLSDTNSDNVPDTVSTSTRSQSWTMDGQGNWASLNTDGSSVSRTHNKQNQVTAVGSNSLTFDANGNLTTDETGQQYVYDAWNRLVTVKNSGGTTIASYKYDALGRRIQQTESSTTTDFYFSAAWQVVEEQVSGTTKVQYVWSPVYVDAMIERDRDADGNAGNGLEERLYVQQDANYNVTAIINTSGAVQERYIYDPYGSVSFLSSGWTGPADAYNWRYLHQGARLDSVTGLYHFRNRDLSPSLGRWLEVDPLGFAAGDTNCYRYVNNNPANLTDPLGLIWYTHLFHWNAAYEIYEYGKILYLLWQLYCAYQDLKGAQAAGVPLDAQILNTTQNLQLFAIYQQFNSHHFATDQQLGSTTLSEILHYAHGSVMYNIWHNLMTVNQTFADAGLSVETLQDMGISLVLGVPSNQFSIPGVQPGQVVAVNYGPQGQLPNVAMAYFVNANGSTVTPAQAQQIVQNYYQNQFQIGTAIGQALFGSPCPTAPQPAIEADDSGTTNPDLDDWDISYEVYLATYGHWWVQFMTHDISWDEFVAATQNLRP